MDIISRSLNTISINDFKQFKNLKVIIFDFDDTLYRNLSWIGWEDFLYENFRKILSNLGDEEFKNLLDKYNFGRSKMIENFAKILTNENFGTNKLNEFLQTIKFETDWENASVFPQTILKKLSETKHLYILSNSAEENIKFVSKKVGLKLDYFKKIMSNKFESDDLTKSKKLKEIIGLENINPCESLMIGDSIEYDLMPAKKIGTQIMLIKDDD